jgi:exodeoxyribonuclease V gamma subunit
LDDGVFPRAAREDGDNLLAREPAVGERDLRSEDRQLMLDALMAATEKVVVTYTGADERTGARRPPAVPLGELLDALDDTAATATGGPARSQILVRHPLQPYDSRTVMPGALGRAGPFSFDPTALRGARAATGARVPAPVFLPSPLAAAPRRDVDLADLIALITHPVKGFLRQRLDVGIRFEQDDPSDALPVDLNSLELWGVGDRLLRARLAGVPENDCRQAELRRGVLPPFQLGSRTLETLFEEVRPLVDKTASLRAVPRRTVDVVVDLSGGRQLRGTVGGLHEEYLVAVSYSKLGPAARLRAWLSMLALSAGHPDKPWGAATVGRGDRGRPQCATLTPIKAQAALPVLQQLVELYDKGLREPLPMPVKSAAEYAAHRLRGAEVDDAEYRARMKWATGSFPGEDDDAAHAQVWGRRAPFETLLTATPPDETWGGEPHRFGELAVRMWFPLLDHEKRSVL